MTIEEAYGKPTFKYMMMNGLSSQRDYMVANNLKEVREKVKKFIELTGARLVSVYKVVKTDRPSYESEDDFGWELEGAKIFSIKNGKIIEEDGDHMTFLHVGWFLYNFENLEKKGE